MYNKNHNEKEILTLAFENHKKNKLKVAESLYKKIIKTNPNHFDSIFLLGSLSAQIGNFKAAEKYLNQAAKINPNSADTYHNLGIIYGTLEEYKKAIISSQKAIEIQPNHIEAINHLGNLYKDLREFKKAKNCYERAIKINPNFAKSYNNLGNILKELGEFEKAKIAYMKAIEIQPKNPNTYYNIGLLYKILGNFTESEIAYKTSLKYQPENLSTLYEISKLNNEVLNSNLKNEIKKHLGKKLSEKNKAYANFLLSKYEIKNKNYKKEINFLIKGHSHYFNSERKKFEKATNHWLYKLPKLKELEKISDFQSIYNKIKPIFIIGVPRCGSTLIEKIIASGPNKIPLGEETGIFSYFVGKRINKKESLEENKGELHSQIYEKYNEKGLIKEKNNFIFTDKSLDNFFYIPLIKEIFPKSKIINCKRDTTSSIMSILKTNLKDVSWAHDLNHIFKFFDLYFKKIEYFKKIFPNFIYELELEKFVSKPKEESKKLFDFCNLSWDEKCLEFYKRKDLISQTASNMQIRKSIFKDGFKKYQPYKKFLKKYGKKYNWYK